MGIRLEGMNRIRKGRAAQTRVVKRMNHQNSGRDALPPKSADLRNPVWIAWPKVMHGPPRPSGLTAADRRALLSENPPSIPRSPLEERQAEHGRRLVALSIADAGQTPPAEGNRQPRYHQSPPSCHSTYCAATRLIMPQSSTSAVDAQAVADRQDCAPADPCYAQRPYPLRGRIRAIPGVWGDSCPCPKLCL